MKRLLLMLFVLTFLIVRYTNSKVDQKIIDRQIKNIMLQKKALNLLLLKYAKLGDNKKIVAILRKGANINTYDNNKQSSTYQQTPLIIATTENHGTTVRFLLQKGANINAQDSQGNTALHLALLRNLPDAMYKLLLNHKASDTIANNAGKTVKILIEERKDQKKKSSIAKPTVEKSPTLT